MERLNHNIYMEVAFSEAMTAFDKGEVPVGAAIYENGEMISSAHNMKESASLPTAHAELRAIERACSLKGDWRLENATLYVTAEPCLMCAGAIIQARIPLVVFGVREPKFGAVVSNIGAFEISAYNHHPEYIEGIMAASIESLMKKFFKELRRKKEQNKERGI